MPISPKASSISIGRTMLPQPPISTSIARQDSNVGISVTGKLGKLGRNL